MASYQMESQGGHPHKAVRVEPDSSYATPGVSELEEMFWTGIGAHYTHVNEVWPNIYIGDEKTALEQDGLEAVGITHIVNAAEGTWNNVRTGAAYYGDMDIQYYGIEADDTPTFNMAQYFYPAAHFIQHALSLPQSKVLVHCVMGRSRSATVVLAYLMVVKGLTVVDAIEHVRQQRCILPNRGFLKQLRTLDITLQEERLGKRQTNTCTLLRE